MMRNQVNPVEEEAKKKKKSKHGEEKRKKKKSKKEKRMKKQIEETPEIADDDVAGPSSAEASVNLLRTLVPYSEDNHSENENASDSQFSTFGFFRNDSDEVGYDEDMVVEEDLEDDVVEEKDSEASDGEEEHVDVGVADESGEDDDAYESEDKVEEEDAEDDIVEEKDSEASNGEEEHVDVGVADESGEDDEANESEDHGVAEEYGVASDRSGEDEANESEGHGVADEEGGTSDRGGDDDGDEEEGEPRPIIVRTKKTNKKKRKRRAPKFADPGSDNDPDPEESGDDPDVDVRGWSRGLKKLKRRHFKGATPRGPTFGVQGITPVQFFFKFFPVHLFILIADWTNAKMQKARQAITITTPAEIRAWLGIHLIMGLSKTANYRDYWSAHPGYRNSLITRTMTRCRFETISQHLMCSDPNDASDPEKMPFNTYSKNKRRNKAMLRRPLHKVQAVWDTVQKRCQENYNCARELAIDEAMIRYRGFKASVHRFFMPCKPIRMGFKVYALAESASGYMCNFEIHKVGSKPIKIIKRAMEVVTPFLNKWHHIFCDKLYSSMQFAQELYSNKTYMTGAIKRSSKDLAVEFSTDARINKNRRQMKKMTSMLKTRRGTFYSRQRGRYTYSLWRDSSIMSLLSSAFSAFRNKVQDTLFRKFSKDGHKRRVKQEVAAPPAIIAYTKNMGGVDRADQLRSYYTCARKSQIWWRQILFFLVDISRVNAWICYKFALQQYQAANNIPDKEPADASDPSDTSDSEDEDLLVRTRLSNSATEKRHSRFTMKIACGLIDGFAEGVANPPQASDAMMVPPHNGPLHRLVRMKGEYGRYCEACKTSGIRTPCGRLKTSRYGCLACDVHFCKGHCFTR